MVRIGRVDSYCTHQTGQFSTSAPVSLDCFGSERQLTFVYDHFVSEYDYLELSTSLQTRQYVSTCFATRLNVECAYADPPDWSERLGCPLSAPRLSQIVLDAYQLLRSLAFGLPALLATLLLLVCLCWVRLRDRRGIGLDKGPEFQDSRCLAAALGGLDVGSLRALTGTIRKGQLHTDGGAGFQ